MTTFSYGVASVISGDSVSLSNRVVTGAAVGDPVWKDSADWKKATWSTNAPAGVFVGSGVVVLRDRATGLSGLTAGKFYYLAEAGGLTTTYGSIKIGMALSSTELLVDIDVTVAAGIDDTGVSGIGTAGYYGGGVYQVYQTIISKMLFSNETTSLISDGLSIGRYAIAAVNSTNSGYFIGGNGASTVFFTVIDKLRFSDDGVSTLSTRLSRSRSQPSGFNSDIAGYAAGGSAVSTIDKLTFATEINSAINSTLTVGSYGLIGYNSTAAGYASGGGVTTTDTTYFSHIHKLIFINDSVVKLTSRLSFSGFGGQGMSSDIAGYVCGANIGIFGASTSVINKLTFANDTNSALNIVVSAAVSEMLSLTRSVSSTAAGYAAGGSTSVDKLIFSNDTIGTLIGVLPAIQTSGYGLSNHN